MTSPIKRAIYVHYDTPRPKGKVQETKTSMVQRETFSKEIAMEIKFKDYSKRFSRRIENLELYFSKLNINGK